MAAKPGAHANAAAPDEFAERRERERRAVELAKSGMDYERIAQTLGYANRGGAWKAVHRAIDRQEAVAVADLRAMENARLDAVQLVLWPLAMKGDLKAIDRLLRLFERRARLNGLDMPTQFVASISDDALRDPEQRRARIIELTAELERRRAEADALAAPAADDGD